MSFARGARSTCVSLGGIEVVASTSWLTFRSASKAESYPGNTPPERDFTQSGVEGVSFCRWLYGQLLPAYDGPSPVAGQQEAGSVLGVRSSGLARARRLAGCISHPDSEGLRVWGSEGLGGQARVMGLKGRGANPSNTADS